MEISLKPEDHEARHFSFDVVLGASGKAVNLEGFKRYKFKILKKQIKKLSILRNSGG